MVRGNPDSTIKKSDHTKIRIGINIISIRKKHKLPSQKADGTTLTKYCLNAR